MLGIACCDYLKGGDKLILPRHYYNFFHLISTVELNVTYLSFVLITLVDNGCFHFIDPKSSTNVVYLKEFD